MSLVTGLFARTDRTVLLKGAASYLSGSSALVRGGFNFLVRRLKVAPLVETTPYNYMWNWTDPLLNLAQSLLPFIVPIDNVGILNKVTRGEPGDRRGPN